MLCVWEGEEEDEGEEGRDIAQIHCTLPAHTRVKMTRISYYYDWLVVLGSGLLLFTCKVYCLQKYE